MRAWPAATLFAVLCGCSGVPLGEQATRQPTGRTAIDHVVSLALAKDCAYIRTRQGLTLCREDERPVAAAGYCYRTLGEVTCYPAADPYPGGQAEIGTPPSVGQQGISRR